MKSVKLLSLLASLGVFVAASFVQAQTATPQGGPPALAIVRHAQSAMGCANIGPDTAIAVSGSLRVPSVSMVMHVSIESQGNHRWRSELDTPKERKVTVVNDGEGEIQHEDGRVTKLARHNTSHQRPTHIPCLTNLGLPPEKLTAGFLRADTGPSDTMDVIDLIPSDAPGVKKSTDRMKITVWISRETGYLTKLEYVNASEQEADDTQTVEVTYSDYRVVNGVAVPFRQTTIDGDMALELALDSVQINTSPADFKLRGR